MIIPSWQMEIREQDTLNKAGCTIWLTGYSGAGKTTISRLLREKLAARALPCEMLDGDELRTNLCKDLGFSWEDRCTNILRIGFVAELLSRHGVFVIVSAISPYRSARDAVRERIPNFVEVHVRCSIEACEKRDVKGLYKKARAGEISNFTGISDRYEAPFTPEIVCDTEQETVEQSVEKLLAGLEKLNFI
jgi:adenylylsulfate kinase